MSADRAKASRSRCGFGRRPRRETRPTRGGPRGVLELNEGQAQESHRRYTLPPTVTAAETGEFIAGKADDAEPASPPVSGFRGDAVNQNAPKIPLGSARTREPQKGYEEPAAPLSVPNDQEQPAPG